MAVITARVATNLSTFNLTTLLGGDNSLQLLDNVNFTSAQGYLYQDLARAASASSRFDFAGSGITIDGSGAITGGTVSGLLRSVSGTSGFTPSLAIEGISTSALSVWSASRTSSTSDDLALLESLLWSNDSFSLSTGNDRASGFAGNDTMRGNSGNDTLFGGVGNDSLSGGAGNDSLDGGTFGDRMNGGTGDDVYVVDSAGDIVVESSGQGSDTVRSSINYVLVSNVERLTLTGSDSVYGFGNGQSNTITGNSGANSLRGAAGNDTLSGGSGNDTLWGETGADSLIGGSGNDTYILFGETSTDKTVELSGGGTDTVESHITHTLASHVENLELKGTSAINGTGNTSSNVLIGNVGANRLSGGAGNDTIDGFAGNDTLTGGTGRDVFLFSTLGNPFNNLDRIIDFVSADDTIRLNNDSAPYLGPDGALAASAFRIGSAAGDASDRIIYNQTTGALFFDSDGTGAGVMLQLAQLTAGTVLTASDFVLV